MRRRIKPKVVWLPSTNTNSIDSGLTSTWQFASVAIGTGGDAFAALEIPLVMDGTASDPLDPTSSLADIESSGYRLRRIVGKVFCFISQTGDVGPAEDIYGVTAGFIVRRSDPATGLSLASPVQSDIDPAKIRNSMDPWIWRRSWLLSNGPDFAGIFTGVNPVQLAINSGAGPGVNFGYAYQGATEGPTVDQKTARIVGPEERLFLDVSATTIITGGSTPLLVVVSEIRALASMRANIGNRRNASR